MFRWAVHFMRLCGLPFDHLIKDGLPVFVRRWLYYGLDVAKLTTSTLGQSNIREKDRKLLISSSGPDPHACHDPPTQSPCTYPPRSWSGIKIGRPANSRRRLDHDKRLYERALMIARSHIRLRRR